MSDPKQRISETDTEQDFLTTASDSSYEKSSVAVEQSLPCPESNFGDNECGEPQRAQQLFFDFTPNTEIDTPDVREKVMHFFEFINAQKDIAHLCRMPEPEPEKKSKPTTTQMTQKVDESPEDSASQGPNAQTLLHTYRECVSQISKKQTSLKVDSYPACSSGSESDITEPKRLDQDTIKKLEAKAKAASIKKRAKLKDLCKTLEDWDEKHPKPMDPPGPVLQHKPIMQRKEPPPYSY